MKRPIYLSMAMVLLVGFLPVATMAQPAYGASQGATGQPRTATPITREVL